MELNITKTEFKKFIKEHSIGEIESFIDLNTFPDHIDTLKKELELLKNPKKVKVSSPITNVILTFNEEDNYFETENNDNYEIEMEKFRLKKENEILLKQKIKIQDNLRTDYLTKDYLEDNKILDLKNDNDKKVIIPQTIKITSEIKGIGVKKNKFDDWSI